MNRELITLQRLLNTVDDARMCQCRVARSVVHPHVKRVLDHAAQVHLEIGADLADHIVKAGHKPSRRGSAIGSLRAMQTKWIARFSIDIEALFVMRAAKCETRVLRRLRGMLADVHDAELRARLRGHQRKIEHIYLKISQFGFLMQMRAKPTEKRAFARHRAVAHTPEPQPARTG